MHILPNRYISAQRLYEWWSWWTTNATPPPTFHFVSLILFYQYLHKFQLFIIFIPFCSKFKDYAPLVFRGLRARFGIDPSDYLNDLCGDFNYIEFISNSKSGQFFFYSYNGKLMIKTQTSVESKFLRRILPRYYVYVMKNSNTLLSKFYGMHRVKMHHLKKKMHFVIMHRYEHIRSR